jgi:hypothetical protein
VTNAATPAADVCSHCANRTQAGTRTRPTGHGTQIGGDARQPEVLAWSWNVAEVCTSRPEVGYAAGRPGLLFLAVSGLVVV